MIMHITYSLTMTRKLCFLITCISYLCLEWFLAYLKSWPNAMELHQDSQWNTCSIVNNTLDIGAETGFKQWGLRCRLPKVVLCRGYLCIYPRKVLQLRSLLILRPSHHVVMSHFFLIHGVWPISWIPLDLPREGLANRKFVF